MPILPRAQTGEPSVTCAPALPQVGVYLNPKAQDCQGAWSLPLMPEGISGTCCGINQIPGMCSQQTQGPLAHGFF